MVFFNSRTADWIFDGVIIALLWYVYKTTRRIPLSTLIIALFLGVTLHFAHFRLVSRKLIPKTLSYKRPSPSLVLPNYVRVNTVIPEAKTKDQSDHSFPGDHAVTCALFIFTVGFLFGRRQGLKAFTCSLPIVIARVALGAHWLTDVVIGGFLPAYFYLTLIYYTPIFTMVTKRVDLLRRKIRYA